jgi:hypothetical protein
VASRHQKELTLYASADLNLSGVTLAAERTSSTFSTKGYRHLTVYVNLTARTSLTAVVCKLKVGPSASALGQTKSESVASGTGTLSSYSQSFATTSTGVIPFRFDVDDDFAHILVSGTSGAAGDVCTVDARLST